MYVVAYDEDGRAGGPTIWRSVGSTGVSNLRVLWSPRHIEYESNGRGRGGQDRNTPGHAVDLACILRIIVKDEVQAELKPNHSNHATASACGSSRWRLQWKGQEASAIQATTYGRFQTAASASNEQHNSSEESKAKTCSVHPHSPARC